MAVCNVVVEDADIGRCYRSLLNAILSIGEECSPRGMKIKEIINLTISCENMRKNVLLSPERDLNYRFMIAEWAWVMAGRSDVATLANYNKNYLNYSDDGVSLAGAYGPRLVPQLHYVVNSLRQDPESRQAVLSIWTPSPRPSKDIPCTLNMQFFIRDGRLHQIVNMRSSDAYLGIPYDWFTFSMIGLILSDELGVKSGSYMMNLGSSHLYEPHWDSARQVVEGELSSLRSPRLEFLPDPRAFDCMLDRPEQLETRILKIYAKALHSANKRKALENLYEAAKLT